MPFSPIPFCTEPRIEIETQGNSPHSTASDKRHCWAGFLPVPTGHWGPWPAARTNCGKHCASQTQLPPGHFVSRLRLLFCQPILGGNWGKLTMSVQKAPRHVFQKHCCLPYASFTYGVFLFLPHKKGSPCFGVSLKRSTWFWSLFVLNFPCQLASQYVERKLYENTRSGRLAAGVGRAASTLICFLYDGLAWQLVVSSNYHAQKIFPTSDKWSPLGFRT